MRPEEKVEQRLVSRVENEFGGLCEKFTSPGRRNVPDRLLTLPGGQMLYIELKAPGEEPRLGQRRDHKKRRKLGADVRVLSTYEEVDAFIDEMKGDQQ